MMRLSANTSTALLELTRKVMQLMSETVQPGNHPEVRRVQTGRRRVPLHQYGVDMIRSLAGKILA